MTTAEMLEHLRTEALKLPEQERRALMRSLQETLDDDDDSDDEVSPEWHDELARRRASVRNGTVDMLSAPDVIAEIRNRFLLAT